MIPLRPSPSPAWALFAAAALASLAGCSPAACDTSDGANPADRYTGGTVSNGVYQSSSWHAGLLPFPGGKRYDLVHGLGFEPMQVQVWLSFSANGTGADAETDTAAPSAGNSGEIQLVNDEVIRIKNDSCADFWVRVTASGDPRPAGSAGSPDASAD
jgi:hypothetical protein